MIRPAMIGLTLALSAVLPGWTTTRDAGVPRTGWFSDTGCAGAKVNAGDFTPNGTACVRKCLEEGAVPVFVDPKARAMYEVRDYARALDDVGYYLEVTATVDEDAKTIVITSVKRLGEVAQMCARPPKKS